MFHELMSPLLISIKPTSCVVTKNIRGQKLDHSMKPSLDNRNC